MSRADFDEFVKRNNAKENNEKAFDPKQQLMEWLAYLDDLYSTVEDFIASYIKTGTARIEFQPISLNEEFSGPYDAKQMLLHIGHSVISFKPVGTMLIGSKGRVDVQGPRGGARLGLVNRKATEARQLVRVNVSIDGQPPRAPEVPRENIDWAWKIITPAPQMKFLELNEDNFFDMILGIADAKLASLDDIAAYHADAETSLRYYYSTSNPDYQTRFTGYFPSDVSVELTLRVDETEMRSILVILARVEAAFRQDYQARATSMSAEPISIAFRRLYSLKGARARLEEEILNTWREQLDPADRPIISNLKGMLKYRHWLAHGRYWNQGRPLAYQDVYLLADVIFSGLPLQS